MDFKFVPEYIKFKSEMDIDSFKIPFWYTCMLCIYWQRKNYFVNVSRQKSFNFFIDWALKHSKLGFISIFSLFKTQIWEFFFMRKRTLYLVLLLLKNTKIFTIDRYILLRHDAARLMLGRFRALPIPDSK